MPFNGSGVFTLAEPAFVANTTIASADVNSDLSDIATGLTTCLTNDGQSTMTAQLKGFAGTLAAPGYSWATDLNTGRYRPGADQMSDVCGGVSVAEYAATGVTFPLALTVTTTITVPNTSFTYAKLQNVSATDKVLGRSSSGAGVIEEITCTSAGRDLLDDATASDQRTTLGLTTAATTSIGTSGAAIPLLNGNNTYSGTSTFTSSSGILARNTARAFLNFTTDGSGNPTLQATSFNIASITGATVAGTNGFTVTFTSGFSGTTYVSTGQGLVTATAIDAAFIPVSKSTGSISFIFRRGSDDAAVAAGLSADIAFFENS